MPSGILTRRRTVFAGAAAGGGLSYDATILAEGSLTHYYKLNETSGTTAADSIGGTNATLSGTASVNQSPIFSDSTKSYSFGGGNVQVSTSRLIGSTSPWTIECEFYCTSISSAGAVWSVGNGGLTHYACLTPLASGHLSLTQFTGAGGTYTTITVTNSTAYHCVATYDGTNITVYLNGGVANGGQEGAVAYSQSSNGPGNAFLIGSNGNGQNFPGRISKVAIYNSVLTQTQITAHWLAVNNP